MGPGAHPAGCPGPGLLRDRGQRAAALTRAQTILAILALALASGLARGDQEADTRPATATRPAAPSNHQRVEDLIAVIEGPSGPEVRSTVARELLLHDWPETPPRVVAILAGPNAAAKMTMATSLAELPEFLRPEYVEPLMGMLADPDQSVRDSGARALAAYRDGGVIPRLHALAQDADEQQVLRLAAISTLGLIPRRDAIDGLADVLADPNPAIAGAALSAFEQATAMDFGGDIAAARAWWRRSSVLGTDEWQERQIERLVRKARETQRALERAEARLVKSLEANFARAPESERLTMLAAYLGDGSVGIRLLGLRLTQLLLAEGKSLPDELPQELRDQIRRLMDSTDVRVQAAAVRTVASFRAAEDAERFLGLLGSARHPDVIQAIVNGLGYVGTGSAVQPLLGILEKPNELCVTEAVTALGRLAERGVLAEGRHRSAVAAALLGVFARTTPAQVALRERTVWAMGIIEDPSFGPAFASALAREEGVAVRQAAARGIAALNDPTWTDALADAVSDPDAAVRKTAIDTLATLGSTDGHLEALWRRLAPAAENTESIRQAVATAVIELLARRPADQIETWLARLPKDGSEHVTRMSELLERLSRRVGELDPEAHDRQGVIRARVAALRLESGQLEPAFEAYEAALRELHAAGSSSAARVGKELLRAALVHGRYGEGVARALAGGNPGAAPEALWEIIATEIECRLQPETVDQAIAMLDVIEQHPPGPLPVDAMAQLRARAAALKQPPPVPASQPASESATADGEG